MYLFVIVLSYIENSNKSEDENEVNDEDANDRISENTTTGKKFLAITFSNPLYLCTIFLILNNWKVTFHIFLGSENANKELNAFLSFKRIENELSNYETLLSVTEKNENRYLETTSKEDADPLTIWTDITEATIAFGNQQHYLFNNSVFYLKHFIPMTSIGFR